MRTDYRGVVSTASRRPRPDARSPRGTARVAEVLAALLAIALPALTPYGVSGRGAVSANVQVARGSGSSHKAIDDDLDSDSDAGTSDSSSKGRRLPGMKSAPGGYDPKRVQRFWRHYHGARPAGKVKRLERRK